ncbi:hypothetical protein [Streptococcus marimammalium]|uniref:hypothetical protein n=1 Tax=Streptococcus marimammalium TaxID=269666 RepID=UPI00037719AB|nr:hypothetical protein [Streptococcus marimammalium]
MFKKIAVAVSELRDSDYILVSRTIGGYFRNYDGSNNFSQEEINAVDGIVMTLPEYKEYLKTVPVQSSNDSFTFTPLAATPPRKSYNLPANKVYTSDPFTASGWRYGEFRFYPALGTGSYLYWSALGDSGLVENGYGISVAVYPGSYTPVYSGQGTYFKTYNPVRNSKYIVSNPV